MAGKDPAGRLLTVQALFNLATSLAGIFFNVLLFRMSGLDAVVAYTLATIACLVASFYNAGFWMRHVPCRVLMQVGVLLQAAVYGLVLVLGDQAPHYLIPLGLLNGLAQGHYWSGNNMNQFMLTQENTRNGFLGRQGFLLSTTQAIGPAVAGGVISLSGLFAQRLLGYHLVFLAVVVTLVVTAVLMQGLPSHAPLTFSFAQFRHRRHRNWWIVLGQWFAYGLSDMLFSAVSGILLIGILREEATLGLVTTLQTLLVGVTAIAVGRILQRRRQAFVVGMVFWPLGLLLFAVQQNLLGVACFVLLVGVSQSFLSIPVSKGLYDAMEEADGPWQHKYFLLVERETVLGTARLLSCALFLCMADAGPLATARVFSYLCPMVPLMLGLFEAYRTTVPVRAARGV